MMIRKGIGIMFAQEPMLRAHTDPAFTEPMLLKVDLIHFGRRGSLIIIHPSWEHMISIPDFDSPDCTNIQWIAVRFGSNVLYIANVYLPNRHYPDDKKLATDIVNTLITNINTLPVSSLVIVVGDLNADMHTFSKSTSNRGVNFGLVKQLISSTLLQVVPRPNESCFTRPLAKTHPDGILASKSALKLFVKDIEYVSEPLLRNTGHDDQDLKSASDHIPYLAHLSVQREPRTAASGFKTRWNTRLLLNEGSDRYKTALDILAQRYILWQAEVIAMCNSLAFSPNHDVAEMLYEGLK